MHLYKLETLSYIILSKSREPIRSGNKAERAFCGKYQSLRTALRHEIIIGSRDFESRDQAWLPYRWQHCALKILAHTARVAHLKLAITLLTRPIKSHFFAWISLVSLKSHDTILPRCLASFDNGTVFGKT